MELLKAAELPTDRRPIERLGVMSQIEMYNVLRVTRVSVLASFERDGLNAEAWPRIGPSADRILPAGAEQCRIGTKTVSGNSFVGTDLIFGWWRYVIESIWREEEEGEGGGKKKK